MCQGEPCVSHSLSMSLTNKGGVLISGTEVAIRAESLERARDIDWCMRKFDHALVSRTIPLLVYFPVKK